VYNCFLDGNLKELEKVCGEQALGYFKVLLKKNEVEVIKLLYRRDR
jgi:import inner membrane translocase subunit TIM44